MESTEMLLNLTATAVSKIQSFIEEQGASDGAGLRVAVLPGGCSGFQYGLNIEDAPESDDEVFDLSGAFVAHLRYIIPLRHLARGHCGSGAL